ncbi:tripartite tricarboxylate transporter TctB family protein [Sagittula salina]|uniref:Tripartite tricarboxylate transporter TctB family protein n=1 Tax=Sagittula salina TaxID=2820268 RepID=A0A940MRK0_9RHOB|nr:tripartite tricarboxylate transporter TctB family protein [Sagittula salina]MBP0484530.1 tripartite tricarboxylate transporter TctB family protein [Sagittula salina]
MARYATWITLALLGAAAFIMALRFGWGRGPQIGSAPLPAALSAGVVIVSVLGLLVPERGEVLPPDWRPFGAVVGGVVIFILSVEALGLVPATVLCMAVAYLGQSERRYAGFLTYAVCFAAGVWVVFTQGLGLPVPAFGG